MIYLYSRFIFTNKAIPFLRNGFYVIRTAKCFNTRYKNYSWDAGSTLRKEFSSLQWFMAGQLGEELGRIMFLNLFRVGSEIMEEDIFNYIKFPEY
ncbi:MAG: hypothetical protein JSS63_09945 [Bacteroidetes bacterium]|nr:hypothetical protein [Bacteroidota bacterium]